MTKDDNLSNYTPHYYVNETFSTTCKGTERDAILLFVATGIGKQKQLFTEIVTKTKINIVTCKECNKVILHNIKDKWIVCPHCLSNNSKVKLPGIPLSIAPYDTSNFPDLYPH